MAETNLKRHYLASRAFAVPDDLDRAVHAAIALIDQLRAGTECADIPIAAS
jgi:hypothetical protein